MNIRQALLTVLLMTGVSGCQTAVIGSCEIPQQYDAKKTVPGDLPPGTTAKGLAEAATAERGQHKLDVDDFNGFHDYVRDNCAH